MWIVSLALRRPYTFVVLAILLLIVGPLSIMRTPVDIFPNINIPVLSVVWQYNGLSPQEMTDRITSVFERAVTSDVANIEHVESQSLNSVAVVKIFFHPGTNISQAVAQTVSSSASLLRVLPPGTLPPNIISYNASTVPILELGLSSKTLSEQQLYDIGNSTIRPQLATIQGTSVPLPFGGKVRQVMVDIDSAKLQARGLSPTDVVNAVNAQSVILPGGTAKIGTREYNVQMNGSTATIDELNALPVKNVNGTVVYLRDVAHVRDGYAPQTNLVRNDGHRSALLEIEKSGATSTLTIVSQIKALLPKIQAGLPKSLTVQALNDQSVFVRAAVSGVVREALIAACLTALMILLFLGNWRPTLIVAITIPLSVLTSLTFLYLIGETINIQTLGGLALAVGILVDDATVAIENITHHLEKGEAPHDAILQGSGEIAVPTFVSTLSICIVFAPMFLLSGVARYLFVPLAESVIFAMAASYFFSRTLIPTLAMYLMRPKKTDAAPRFFLFRTLARFQQGFEKKFEALRLRYKGTLQSAVTKRRVFLPIFYAFCLLSLGLYMTIGEDFFPAVDAGEIKLHVRVATGTRIETTAAIVDQIESAIKTQIPKNELTSVVDNIGLPVSGINLTYDASGPIGTEDADIMISLGAKHKPTASYVSALRSALPAKFPDVTFSFLPADIVSQILNFGTPAPIDIQIVGKDAAGNRQVADQLLTQLKHVRGLVDTRIQQPANLPTLNVDVDRTQAIQAGYTQQQVAQTLLIALSGSAQTTPNFWLNPATGISYPLVAMVPQYNITTLQALLNLPLTLNPSANGVQTLLGSIATVRRSNEAAAVTHYNVQPVLDIYGSVQGTDMGSVARQVEKLVSAQQGKLPQGSSMVVRGQVQSMQQAFSGLLFGIVFAIVLVYLLMVVNFQSWVDPFIIVSGLPASLAGIGWLLFATHTTLSVPALTGAILCIGVATANSILVINNARELMHDGAEPMIAAVDAGFNRFRPVLMTALAMLIGMLPMALGLGEGGEQNAPLGRAVMGGLAFGSVATLLVVPVIFGAIHTWLQRRQNKSSGTSGTSGTPEPLPRLPAPDQPNGGPV